MQMDSDFRISPLALDERSGERGQRRYSGYGADASIWWQIKLYFFGEEAKGEVVRDLWTWRMQVGTCTVGSPCDFLGAWRLDSDILWFVLDPDAHLLHWLELW